MHTAIPLPVPVTPCNQERLVKLLGLEPTALQAPRLVNVATRCPSLSWWGGGLKSPPTGPTSVLPTPY